MDYTNLGVIILAAGKGTRFGESHTKLLHPVLGKPLICYPLQNLQNLGIKNLIAVISDPKMEEEVKKYITCDFVYQKELTGTADAVKLALPQIPAETKNILVLNGDDATLYSKKSLEEFLESHNSSGAAISLMTIKTDRDMEAGRIIRDSKNNFSKILEQNEYEKSGAKSREINCGVYLINFEFSKNNLPEIQKSQNGEYYLTDLLNIAKEKGSPINLFVLKNHSDWIGINTKKDLKYAENIIKKRHLDPELSKEKPVVHFLGIAGSGTSASANLAKFQGFKVTGCDMNLSGEFAESVKDIDCKEGHDPKHLEGVDILAVTPAVLSLDPNNPELIAAKKIGLKIMTWQQFTGKFLTQGKIVIAICGTHGKSTTTSMVAGILEDAGLDPTVLLGATIKSWGKNYRAGKGKYFVIEADEFNDNYMSFNPDFTILTNIEFDHPEFFKDYEAYEKSFQNFLHKTKNLILANLSDENSKKAIIDIQKQDGTFFAPVSDYSKNLIDFPLSVHGKRNILNASAAFNLGLNLEINPEKIKKSLKEYKGIVRRMELLAEINGAQIYSDFGHHPTEIKVTVAELRQNFPDRKIYVVYQPHMFSRTKALFGDFVEVFKNIKADGTFIVDIYPSREKDTGIVSSQELVEAIEKDNVRYFKSLEEAYSGMKACFVPGSIVLFMGAGDIDERIRKLLNV